MVECRSTCLLSDAAFCRVPIRVTVTDIVTVSTSFVGKTIEGQHVQRGKIITRMSESILLEHYILGRNLYLFQGKHHISGRD